MHKNVNNDVSKDPPIDCNLSLCKAQVSNVVGVYPSSCSSKKLHTGVFCQPLPPSPYLRV